MKAPSISLLKLITYCIVIWSLLTFYAPKAHAEPVIKHSPELQLILNNILEVSNKSNRAHKAKAYINWSSNLVTAAARRDRSTVFHRGLMKITDNDHELALLIGHELAHILNGDLGHSHWTGELKHDFDMDKYKESQADVIGTILMHKAGYDCHEGAKVWKRYIHRLGDKTGPSHPKPSERYEKIKRVCDIQHMRDKERLTDGN